MTGQNSGVDTSPDNNAGTIVIKGKDLDALSDDPDQLQVPSRWIRLAIASCAVILNWFTGQSRTLHAMLSDTLRKFHRWTWV